MERLESLLEQRTAAFSELDLIQSKIKAAEQLEASALVKDLVGKCFLNKFTDGRTEYLRAIGDGGNGSVTVVRFMFPDISAFKTNIWAIHLNKYKRINGSDYARARDAFFAEARQLLEGE